VKQSKVGKKRGGRKKSLSTRPGGKASMDKEEEHRGHPGGCDEGEFSIWGGRGEKQLPAVGKASLVLKGRGGGRVTLPGGKSRESNYGPKQWTYSFRHASQTHEGTTEGLRGPALVRKGNSPKGRRGGRRGDKSEFQHKSEKDGRTVCGAQIRAVSNQTAPY